MNRVFISIFGFDIYWYAILILIGILIGIFLACKEAKRISFGYSFMNDLSFYIIPISLIIVQYSFLENTAAAVNFRIEITGILLILFVILVLKKVFINKKIEALRERLNNQIAQIEIENDQGKILNLQQSIKNKQTVLEIFNAIIPLILLIAGVVACKAMEAAIIKLSGVLGCIALSYIIGVGFGILAARQVESKHLKEEDKAETEGQINE